jgi:hypothetical protein
MYWGNAYFRDDFDKVSVYYGILEKHLETTLKATGTFSGKPLGSKSGISVKELWKCYYLMGIPYFDDPVELAEFDSYHAAIPKIESSLKNGVLLISQHQNIPRFYTMKYW